MLSLASYGIAPSDALKLIEYNEVEWFTKELALVRKRQDMQKQLRDSEAIAYGNIGASSNKGLDTYNRWRVKVGQDIIDTTKNKTIWDTLKNPPPKKIKTFWDVVKGKN